MKIVLSFLIYSFLALSVISQTEKTENPAEVAVESISLARDDGKGNPGEITDKFTTADTPIYCLIKLNATEPATIKMILVAVKAVGLPPETKSISVSYTTKGNENGVNFNASPDKDWQAGDYRFDVFVNGKFSKSVAFEITKPATEARNENPSAQKNFAPSKKSNKPKKN